MSSVHTGSDSSSFIRYGARKPARLVLQDECGRDSIFPVLRENTTR